MPPPDLDDPAQRRAYRRELLGVARAERYWGVFLAMIGIALLWMRGAGWLTIPDWLPLVLLGGGIAAMLLGMIRRTGYHQRRMRGD